MAAPGYALISKEYYENVYRPLDNAGVKYDDNKLPLDLIPPEVLLAAARVLQYGAEKYSRRNWEKGLNYSRMYAALQRHLIAWQMGKVFDIESGLPHLDCALVNLMFLVTHEKRGMQQFDDFTRRVKC